MTLHDRALIAAMVREMQAAREALDEAATLLRQQSALIQRIMERQQQAELPGIGWEERG